MFQYTVADEKAGPSIITSYDGTCSVDYGCSVQRIFTSSPATGGGGTSTPAPGTCVSKVLIGGDCTQTPNCCPDGLTCYQKDSFWASCASSCIAGIHNDDDIKFRTPWSCKVLSTNTGGVGLTACTDVPPGNDFTCKQQKQFGKCGADWMVGFCKVTCGTCNGIPTVPPTVPPPATQPPTVAPPCKFKFGNTFYPYNPYR